MARLRGHAQLDERRPLFVKRAALTVAGRLFALGDLFPWRDLGISRRLLTRMWEQRRIGHERPTDRNGAEPVRVAKLTEVSTQQQKPKRPARTE